MRRLHLLEPAGLVRRLHLLEPAGLVRRLHLPDPPDSCVGDSCDIGGDSVCGEDSDCMHSVPIVVPEEEPSGRVSGHQGVSLAALREELRRELSVFA